MRMVNAYIVSVDHKYVGKPLYDESGELVCIKPFPSMPTHFWNDEDGIRYQKSYFSLFQGNYDTTDVTYSFRCMGTW